MRESNPRPLEYVTSAMPLRLLMTPRLTERKNNI
jgi:hypothetical protein